MTSEVGKVFCPQTLCRYDLESWQPLGGIAREVLRGRDSIQSEVPEMAAFGLFLEAHSRGCAHHRQHRQPVKVDLLFDQALPLRLQQLLSLTNPADSVVFQIVVDPLWLRLRFQ